MGRTVISVLTVRRAGKLTRIPQLALLRYDLPGHGKAEFIDAMTAEEDLADIVTAVAKVRQAFAHR